MKMLLATDGSKYSEAAAQHVLMTLHTALVASRHILLRHFR
jgi:hypothetical protein